MALILLEDRRLPSSAYIVSKAHWHSRLDQPLWTDLRLEWRRETGLLYRVSPVVLGSRLISTIPSLYTLFLHYTH
jgi:hypothetical protein